jgi:sulfur carrier protein
MNLVVNGQAQQVADDATVWQVLSHIIGESPTRGVAVAVDGVVVPRTEWEHTQLRPDQKVEILHAVQGG